MFDGMGVARVDAGENAVNGYVAREFGNTMHNDIQQAFLANPDFECEVPVSIPHCMTSGHAAGVYCGSTHDFGTVLEIKAMAHNVPF